MVVQHVHPGDIEIGPYCHHGKCDMRFSVTFMGCGSDIYSLIILIQDWFSTTQVVHIILTILIKPFTTQNQLVQR